MKLFISLIVFIILGIACTSSVSNNPVPTHDVPSIECDNKKQYNFVAAKGFLGGTGELSARDWVGENPTVVILGGKYIGLVYVLTVCDDN